MTNRITKAETTMSSPAIAKQVLAAVDVFDRTAFAEALLTKRVVKLKIGVREAAKEIGISPATLSRCENGKEPDVYTYFYCCRWLEMSMQTFFNVSMNDAFPRDYKQKRLEKGLTLREVEQVTGISNSYLSQLENGKIKKPSYDTIQKLNAVYYGG